MRDPRCVLEEKIDNPLAEVTPVEDIPFLEDIPFYNKQVKPTFGINNHFTSSKLLQYQ